MAVKCEHCGRTLGTKIYDINVCEIDHPTEAKNIRWHIFCDECYSLIEMNLNDWIKFPRKG